MNTKDVVQIASKKAENGMTLVYCWSAQSVHLRRGDLHTPLSKAFNNGPLYVPVATSEELVSFLLRIAHENNMQCWKHSVTNVFGNLVCVFQFYNKHPPW